MCWQKSGADGATHGMLPAARCKASVQCCGVTRSGKRCSITDTTPMVDALSGKLVSEPLTRGGSHCLYHAVYFCTRAIAVPDAVVVFLDLETSGLSILTDNIVEIGVVDDCGATFSTVVRPPIVPAGPTVHGIEESEMQQGPTFACAFDRLMRFLDNLAESAVSGGESSADELMALPSLKSELPDVVLVAHNGMRFDFAMLLSECCRCSLPLDSFTRWRYVDTLAVAKAACLFDCVKLQCMTHMTGCASELRAHRALDDAIALRGVVNYAAESLGVSTLKLMQQFACELDLTASVANLSSVL